jgi:hypothetical protein
VKIGTPTGIEESLAWMSGISLFPNPAAQNPSISFSLKKADFATIRVFNSLGALVYQTKSEYALRHELILEIDRHIPGIYWVSVQVSDKQIGLPLVITD